MTNETPSPVAKVATTYGWTMDAKAIEQCYGVRGIRRLRVSVKLFIEKDPEFPYADTALVEAMQRSAVQSQTAFGTN